MRTRLRTRHLSLLCVLAAAVAVAAACGDQNTAPEGEPLALTLTPAAKHYCETDRARESLGVLNRGWVLSERLALQWRVTGGEPPYALNVEGWRFSRPAGIVWVPCVDTTVPWRWGRFLGEAVRLYDSDPQVDSGWKTVRATVTDANGDTAEASMRFYVILSDPVIMKRGETYRVYDHLITASPTHDLEVVGIGPEYECAENLPASERCELEFGLELLGIDGTARLWLYLSDGAESHRWHVLADGTRVEGRFDGAAGAEGQVDVDRAFDSVSASVGDLPSPDAN